MLTTEVGRDEAAGEVDAAALIDRCAAAGAWDELAPHVERFLALLAPGAPLEHLRLPSDAVAASSCGAGWLAWCEREIEHARRFVAAPPDHDALAVAGALLRRFGAAAPILDELARHQLDERARRAAAVHALVPADAALDELLRRLDQALAAPPAILSYPERLALALARIAGDDRCVERWRAGIGDRVCDRLIALAPGDAECAALAFAIFDSPALHPIRLLDAEPLDVLPEEEAVELADRRDALERLRIALAARESRGDYADAELLRDAIRRIQLTLPRPA